MPAVKVGVISDTHGLVRPEALTALQGSDFIVHAGDIGDPKVLDALARVAPVHAVRGNVDKGDWASGLPSACTIVVGQASLHVLHRLADLDVEPAAQSVAAVIAGHSHKPGMEMRDGVLYLNPGSAGPRRFRLPVAVARLTVDGTEVQGEIVTLDL